MNCHWSSKISFTQVQLQEALVKASKKIKEIFDECKKKAVI